MAHQHHAFNADALRRLAAPERLAVLPPQDIWQHLDIAAASTLLDLGAGIGVFALDFARRLASGEVIAADVVPEALAMLQDEASAAGLHNIRTVHSAAERVPLPDASVDAVVVIDVLHHLPDAVASLRDAFRLLRPGGRVGVADWQPDSPTGPPAQMRVAAEDLCGLLRQAGFAQVATHALSTSTYLVTGSKA